MKAAVLSLALVALTACGASSSAAPPLANQAPAPPGDAAVDVATGSAAVVARVEQLADEMCKCPDSDCVDRVMDHMELWAHGQVLAGEGAPRLTMAQMTQVMDAKDRLSGCMASAYRRRARFTPPPP